MAERARQVICCLSILTMPQSEYRTRILASLPSLFCSDGGPAAVAALLPSQCNPWQLGIAFEYIYTMRTWPWPTGREEMKLISYKIKPMHAQKITCDMLQRSRPWTELAVSENGWREGTHNGFSSTHELKVWFCSAPNNCTVCALFGIIQASAGGPFCKLHGPFNIPLAQSCKMEIYYMQYLVTFPKSSHVHFFAYVSCWPGYLRCLFYVISYSWCEKSFCWLTDWEDVGLLKASHQGGVHCSLRVMWS